MARAKDCKVSKLIITHYHEKCLHQGRGVTVNTIRSNGFWILALVSSVASVIYKCIKCRRLYRHTLEQQMALLHSDRVEESPPFTFSAVDIFGTYSLKNGRKVHKRYAVLFTCMSCRAVHIEVALHRQLIPLLMLTEDLSLFGVKLMFFAQIVEQTLLVQSVK